VHDNHAQSCQHTPPAHGVLALPGHLQQLVDHPGRCATAGAVSPSPLWRADRSRCAAGPTTHTTHPPTPHTPPTHTDGSPATILDLERFHTLCAAPCVCVLHSHPAHPLHTRLCCGHTHLASHAGSSISAGHLPAPSCDDSLFHHSRPIPATSIVLNQALKSKRARRAWDKTLTSDHACP
jgi:hypothetical protein